MACGRTCSRPSTFYPHFQPPGQISRPLVTDATSPCPLTTDTPQDLHGQRVGVGHLPGVIRVILEPSRPIPPINPD
jgi:hypothetical protein